MKIYTIGFTRHSAETFFEALRDAGIRRLVDVRLRNTSQLAGFAKRDDLAFFCRELLEIDYQHELLLAPTPELLADYQGGRVDWSGFAPRFLDLLADRRIEDQLDPEPFVSAPTALLCSEHHPAGCHRRLVVEYLADHWGEVGAVHLPASLPDQ